MTEDPDSNVDNSPQEPIAWDKEISGFLGKVGLLETRKAFDTELLVLSRHQREKLSQEIEHLVENLLRYLEQVTEAIEKEKLKRPSQEEESFADNAAVAIDPTAEMTGVPSAAVTPTRPSAKRKRSLIEDTIDEAEVKYRSEHLNPEQVQIRATNGEMKHRIDTFIQVKKAEIDASNRAEFLRRKDPSEDDITCARADAREINRNIQMKFDIVNNEDGPLARSLAQGKAAVGERGRRTEGGEVGGMPVGVEERLKNLEEHLCVRFVGNTPFTVFERIKALEDKIIRLECDHPTWAAVHFNQPNRQFPPPPPITIATHTPPPARPRTASPPLTSASTTISPTPPLKPFTTSAPQPSPGFKATGRANSSLTRSVMEQLARIQRGAGESGVEDGNGDTEKVEGNDTGRRRSSSSTTATVLDESRDVIGRSGVGEVETLRAGGEGKEVSEGGDVGKAREDS